MKHAGRSLSFAGIFLVATSVALAQGPTPKGLAILDADLVVVCPPQGGSAPMLRDPTGSLQTILDGAVRAVAAKACEPRPLTSTASATTVTVTNDRTNPIFVSFTLQSGSPGPITWSTNNNCVLSGAGIQITGGQTCTASVDSSASTSRFCAAREAAPANCFLAQQNHQTMIETNFETSAAPGCFNKGAPCVWYDISIIPSFCTDKDWATNQCSGTGGASYNLPVATSCGGTTTFACAGPQNSTWGTEQYPSTCGNPNALCVGGTASCVQAYFFPMFSGTPAKYQPNVPCLSGQTFGIVFMAGE